VVKKHLKIMRKHNYLLAIYKILSLQILKKIVSGKKDIEKLLKK
jgi:hypothetical protein